MDTLEWPECNSDKATVGSVVCTVYTDGQPYKPCVLCQTGFMSRISMIIISRLDTVTYPYSDISAITIYYEASPTFLSFK